MLLTLSQPAHEDLDSRHTHDFVPRYPQFRARLSPLPKAERPASPSGSSSVAQPAATEVDMATQHRGLPPPSTILPEPHRMAPSLSAASSVQYPGHMPAPPVQWQGHEDSMRNWLAAKAEEDKRKQEEERTRQETLRLEQRRIEQSMLRESLSGGVPPQLIPMIYAGIGGAGFTQLSIDWLHQYAGQLQGAQQQQVHPSSPELHAQRMLGQTPYQTPAAGQQASIPYPPEASASQQASLAQSYPIHPSSSRTAPTSVPRSIAQAQLPRLTTNDVFIHQTSNNSGSAHPLQQSQTLAHDAPTSSPTIYFHHWVPPSDSKNPQTPATRSRRDDEPMSALPASHLSDGEYRDSPRKRKAQGGHQANPPPPTTTSAPHDSPSFSTASSGSGKRSSGHQRNRSTASAKEDSRPDSRKEELHRLSFQQAFNMRENEEQAEKRSGSRDENSTAPGADRIRGHSRGDAARIPEERTTHLDRPPA